MTLSVTEIYRHPIKAHGVEALKSVALATGKCLPWDRVWAVVEEGRALDANAPEWVSCRNFTRGAKVPELMAITAEVNEMAGTILLTHPRAGSITFDPSNDDSIAAFIAWSKPLTPANRMAPTALYSAPNVGLTDSNWPSVSINLHSSLQALEAQADASLSPLRFRGNIWLNGEKPWQEFDWVGKEIRIGSVRLEVRERIERCLATTANPDTGQRDVDTLKALKTGWGHQDFGVKAYVLQAGTITLNDQVEIL